MDASFYTTLTRQSGLMREMATVANNIANASTTGYRTQGVVFAEHVKAMGQGEDSLSMATATVRHSSQLQGGLTQTNGTFDFAIEGDGFFLIETPNGERLTRAGSFTPNENGDLVTSDGSFVLDAGGAPIFIPPDAGPVSVSADGTVSVEGAPISQIGLFGPVDPVQMVREGGVLFRSDAGVEPLEGAAIVQGFVESSNVDTISQITRMIEVQRTYEFGQSFLDQEDKRLRTLMQTLTK